MKDETEDLIRTIMQCLEVDWQYTELVDACDAERIEMIRAAGRTAGRRLGYKILTRQARPGEREDGRVMVIVVVHDGPDPQDRARMEQRARILIENALKHRKADDNIGDSA
jgi:hypothetical protein